MRIRYIFQGWWHYNVKKGQVHDHPDQPNNAWQATMHRQCQPIYTRVPQQKEAGK